MDEKLIELSKKLAHSLALDIANNKKYPIQYYDVVLDVENETAYAVEANGGWQPYVFYPVEYIVDWLYLQDRMYLLENVCNFDDLETMRRLAANNPEKLEKVTNYWLHYLYKSDMLAKIIRQKLTGTYAVDISYRYTKHPKYTTAVPADAGKPKNYNENNPV